MEILKQFLFSYLFTIGISVLFGIPKNSIIKSGFIGASGWVVFYITSLYLESNITGTFFASIVVGILGELFARHYKKPATIYIIPGIVPLVPGAGMYYTMLALTRKDFLLAANKGIETFFIAAASSIGVIMSTFLSQSIKRVKFKA